MKIKFLRDYAVKAVDGKTYKAGEVVDIGLRSALHFINRGAAQEVVEEVKRVGRPARMTAAPETATLEAPEKASR